MILLTLIAVLAVSNEGVKQNNESSCVPIEVLAPRLERLTKEDWNAFTQHNLQAWWPDKLVPTGWVDGADGKDEVVALGREPSSSCAEHFEFRPTTSVREGERKLTEVKIHREEHSLSEALRVARYLVGTIGPPADAKPAGVGIVDGYQNSEMQYKVDAEWVRTTPLRVKEELYAYVAKGAQDSEFVVHVDWSRETPSAEATPIQSNSPCDAPCAHK